MPSVSDRVWGRSPDLGVSWKCVSHASAVTEVHLRRLDAVDQLHRRVVAVLTVDAPPEEVQIPAAAAALHHLHNKVHCCSQINSEAELLGCHRAIARPC